MDLFALPAAEADFKFGDMERSSKAVADKYIGWSKDALLEKGNLAPMAFFLSETKEIIIFCGPMMKDDDTKDRLVATLKGIARQVNAVAFAFAAEAWTSKCDLGDTHSRKFSRPSQDPNRIECLILSAQYKGQATVLRIAEIGRTTSGKVSSLLEIESKELDKGSTFEGRFAGILDDESGDQWSRKMRWL